MIRITTTGMADVDFLLGELDDFEADRAVKQGLRTGASVFVARGRGNLRQRLISPSGHTGNLQRSFAVRVKRRKPGVLAGFTQSGAHAHLVDRGTTARPHPLTGTSGRMPANYFWTDAESSERGRAVQAVRDGIARAVQRINERRRS